MTRNEIDAEAKRLYTAGQSVRPRWDQLGEGTKSVWRGYAANGDLRTMLAEPTKIPAPRKSVSKFAKYMK